MIEIKIIDLADTALAKQLWGVQQAAYRVESELIAYPNLPPLFQTVADLQALPETFIAAWEGDQVVGAASYLIEAGVLDIYSMVIAPTHFRRGIARQLLHAVETLNPQVQSVIVSTAEKNIPATHLYLSSGYTLVRRQTLPDGLVIVYFEKLLR